ncbi:hypothetical protein FIBSPDRAFT_874240 [Athelia psychrophila]|uniref:Uncharacterized protein n=1 Tax=Athelia psychrophila TaxID=1759441 RepID=A0A165XQ96_9AGAM|nr:hypothetical protein FIBSPDRAFT_874240 [Fibularhizoctonia sp. CBS 109695]
MDDDCRDGGGMGRKRNSAIDMQNILASPEASPVFSCATSNAHGMPEGGTQVGKIANACRSQRVESSGNGHTPTQQGFPSPASHSNSDSDSDSTSTPCEELRAGMRLTTEFGWSDNEDEDAPSPITRRLSTLNISRNTSTAPRRSNHPLMCTVPQQ